LLSVFFYFYFIFILFYFIQKCRNVLIGWSSCCTIYESNSSFVKSEYSYIANIAKIIPRFPNASFYSLSWQMMREIIPILVGWEYKLWGVRRIKIDVDTKLGHLLLRGRKMMYLDYDLLIILYLLSLCGY
jgi:hypothetical protein